MSGEIVVGLVFIEALILSVGLLILPLILVTRRIQKPTLSQVTYFLGIGAGFMFVELYLIKSFILIVGDPFISFTLVVSAILIFSSLGGLWAHTQSIRNIRLVLMTLIGTLILTTAGIELLADHMLKVSRVALFDCAFFNISNRLYDGSALAVGDAPHFRKPGSESLRLVGKRMRIGAQCHYCGPDGDQFRDTDDCGGCGFGVCWCIFGGFSKWFRAQSVGCKIQFFERAAQRITLGDVATLGLSPGAIRLAPAVPLYSSSSSSSHFA